MRAWLVRHWFLLLLTFGLVLAIVRPDWLRPLADRLPLRWAVGLSLFLTAWSLEGRRLALSLARPCSVLWALAISYGCLPLLAVLVGRLLPLADLRLGLFLMACVPCTLSAAVLWTRHAGGDEALALLIVVLTNGMAWLVTPLWLTGAGPTPVSLDVATMMRTLAFVLVVPVVLGQTARCLPGVAVVTTRHRPLIGVVARLLVAAVLIAAAVDAAEQLDRLSLLLCVGTLLACVLVHLAGVFLGLVGGRLPRLARADRIAVGFAASQKTLPVGLLIYADYYRGDYPLAVLPLLAYHAGQLLIDTFIAERLRLGSQNQTSASPPRGSANRG